MPDVRENAHCCATHASKADVVRWVDQWVTAGLSGACPPPPGPDAPIPVLPYSDTPIRTADYVIDGRAFRIAGADPAVMDHVEGTLVTFRHTAPAPRKTLSLHRTTGAEPYLLRVDGTEAMRLPGAAEANGALFQQPLGGVHAGTARLAMTPARAGAT